MTPNQAGLTENQLNVLETYHRRCLRFLLYQLNEDFRLEPHPETDCAALGYRMIQLLRASDNRAFEMICQGVLHALLKVEQHTNPYVAAAMAEMGMTKNKLFEEVLQALRNDAEKEGPIPYGAELLGVEENQATLWNLSIVKQAERESDHTSIVEPALDYLKEKAQEFIDDAPAVTANYMQVLVRLDPEGSKDITEKCLHSLIERQRASSRWDESPAALSVGGEIACALLETAPVVGERAREAAIAWLQSAFNLDNQGDLPEWPPLLVEGRSLDRPDLWIDGLIRAALAASRLLAQERPEHNPAAYLLALSIPQENVLVRAEEMIKLAGPYLPPLDQVKDRAQQLETFWEKGGFHQSVFVMCGTTPSDLQKTLIETIKETLAKHDLTIRHLGEEGVPYHSEPWDNAALYMTGCKYGIALLEGKIESPTPEILYQTGFMIGQGAKILVLWDRSLQEEEDTAFPGVRTFMNGIEPFGYDSSKEKLSTLRTHLGKWADRLLNPDKGEAGASTP